MYGDVHAAKAAPSSEHSSVAASFTVKLKFGVESLLGFVGVIVKLESGAVVSTVHG